MIYLDHAATTPLDPRVTEAMQPYFGEVYGNPSSPHAAGRAARAAVDSARQAVASVFGVRPHEVVFVSSGSEANCLAIFGVAEKHEETFGRPGHMVLSSVEHKCSLRVVERLHAQGWRVTLLPVDRDGRIDARDVHEAIAEDTALVSVQWANNEVGTVQPVEEVYAVCRAAGVPFHSDGVQIIGQIAIPSPLPCDMLSIAAHKFYGPKGIGALIVSESVELCPQILGGGQEMGLRAGTENTPGIVGMAKALEIAMEEQPHESARLTALRDAFIGNLVSLPRVTLNGSRTHRLPNNVNVRVAGKQGETVVIALDLQGICCSTGSACVTGASEPSHVLSAMGMSGPGALENVRFSLGRNTRKEDVDVVLYAMKEIVLVGKPLAEARK